MRVPVGVFRYALLFLTAVLVVAFTMGSAIAQSQIWVGRGLIVQGNNRGGLVDDLRLRLDNNTVFFLEGQSAGQQITFPSQPDESISTEHGEWIFPSRSESRIVAIFSENAVAEEGSTDFKLSRTREIEYILSPENP